MMYMHFCQNCRRIHMLNGHKTLCPTCSQKLKELSISYLDYIEMDALERQAYKDRLIQLTVQ